MAPRQRVLVVDDNVEFCSNVADILALYDFDTDVATNGAQALERAGAAVPDIVLMDVRMPVMDGVQTFHRLQELAPGVPVIMMTAFAMEDLLQEALRAGAFGYLYKPLDFDKLLRLIDNARHSGGLIMIADDNRDLGANMRDVLADEGYRVSLVCDGESAVRLARENRFDIILLDIKLPPLNGLETYLAIRTLRPEVVVVAITGYMREMGGLVKQVLARSAYTCLEKPIDMDQLLALLVTIRGQAVTGTLHKPGLV